MKRILSVLLCFLFAVCFMGCSSRSYISEQKKNNCITTIQKADITQDKEKIQKDLDKLERINFKFEIEDKYERYQSPFGEIRSIDIINKTGNKLVCFEVYALDGSNKVKFKYNHNEILNNQQFKFEYAEYEKFQPIIYYSIEQCNDGKYKATTYFPLEDVGYSDYLTQKQMDDMK